MFYRTNPEALRPLHEWTLTFERFWTRQLTRIKERAERRPAADGPAQEPRAHKGEKP